MFIGIGTPRNLREVHVRGDVCGQGGQQGFGCEASKKLSQSFNAASEALGIQALRTDADHDVEGAHELVSVPQDECPVDVLRAESRRSTC